MNAINKQKRLITQDVIDAIHQTKDRFPQMTNKEIAAHIFGLGMTNRCLSATVILNVLKINTPVEYYDLPINNKQQITKANEIVSDIQKETQKVIENSNQKEIQLLQSDVMDNEIQNMKECQTNNKNEINEIKELLIVHENSFNQEMFIAEKINCIAASIGSMKKEIIKRHDVEVESLGDISINVIHLLNSVDKLVEIFSKMIQIWEPEYSE